MSRRKPGTGPSRGSRLTPVDEDLVEQTNCLEPKVRGAASAGAGPTHDEWRDRFQHAVAEVRAGAPGEWSDDELQQRITQAIEAVRTKRSGAGITETVPLESLSAEKQAKLASFRDRVEATRARFDKMTPEEIREEVKLSVEEARTRQHAGRR